MLQDKYVLFDLDGTLTQSEEGIWNSVRYVAERTGRPVPDPETLRKFIGPPLVWSFRQYMGMTEEEAIQAQEVYRERYNVRGLFENRVYTGVRRMLRMLRAGGWHLGVVTGKPEGPTRRILEWFRLDRYMETVVCARDNRAEKELLIRQALPREHGEVWMVGDRRFDMEGGVRAGVHTIGAAWGYGSREELLEAGAEKVAESPAEAAAWLCPEIPSPRGIFVTMEGLDGSGKGTQLELLSELLERFGFEMMHTREPGGSPIGEKIREILLDRGNREMAAETEALLYAASRAQHVRETIRPALEAGKLVLCDRFVDSSVAYQGGGRNLGIDAVLAINAPALDGIRPDLTVYLDISHGEALRRRCAASEPDRLEMESDSFHARVEEAYHQLVARDPDRFVVVNAAGSREEIAAEIADQVLRRLTEAEQRG